VVTDSAHKQGKHLQQGGIDSDTLKQFVKHCEINMPTAPENSTNQCLTSRIL